MWESYIYRFVAVISLSLRSSLSVNSYDVLSLKFSKMAHDPRMSDREIAAINAAAVTREYRVQPHLGPWSTVSFSATNPCDRLSYRLCYQRVISSPVLTVESLKSVPKAPGRSR